MKKLIEHSVRVFDSLAQRNRLPQLQNPVKRFTLGLAANLRPCWMLAELGSCSVVLVSHSRIEFGENSLVISWNFTGRLNTLTLWNLRKEVKLYYRRLILLRATRATLDSCALSNIWRSQPEKKRAIAKRMPSWRKAFIKSYWIRCSFAFDIWQLEVDTGSLTALHMARSTSGRVKKLERMENVGNECIFLTHDNSQIHFPRRYT